MRKKFYTVFIALFCFTTGVLVGCGGNSKVKADEQGYLKYCGGQKDPQLRDGKILIYEDTVHNKVIYIGSDGMNQHPISIAVTDLNPSK